MTLRELKEMIIQKLQKLPVCVPSSDETHWTVRCPYCGDSNDPTHGHLSIQIDRNNDDVPMVWRCFKCPAKGIINQQFLIDIGTDIDQESANELKKIGKRGAQFNKFANDYIANYKIPVYKSNHLIEEKLRYISERIGQDITIHDAEKLKLILDLKQFMLVNEVWIGTYKDWQIDILNECYVGFLSANNNVITQRCIVPKEKQKRDMKRYLKSIINPNNKNPNTFYFMPASIDLMGTDTLHVHIAEGIFDILGIYFNTSHIEDGNHVFMASCGFGPMTEIQYLVYNGLGYDIKMHLYADNDKSDREMTQSILAHKEMLPWIDSIYLYRNAYPGEKDFGVPENRIDVQKRRIQI